MIRTHLESPFGCLTLIASANALAEVSIGHTRADVPPGTNAILDQAAAQLSEYFASSRRRFTVPTSPNGTPFQDRVWSLLTAIPYGETRSYGELADVLGVRNGARAVGLANGQNPLAIVVPCHRVIGADGALTGYAGGLEAKRWLLEHEGMLTPRLL